MNAWTIGIGVLWLSTAVVSAFRGDGFWVAISLCGATFYGVTAWNEYRAEKENGS